MYHRREEQTVNEAVVMLHTKGGRNRSQIVSVVVVMLCSTEGSCHAVYYRREEQTVNEVAMLWRNRLLMKLPCCGGTDC